jgi:hypothetical protein
MVAVAGEGGGSTTTKPTSYDIAKSLISKLGGDPNNAGMVRAVAIWLRFENSTITGNNPWNIRGSGPCGSHYFGKNGPFHTYCSLDEGLTATANLLKGADHYKPIVTAVRSGKPLDFLMAVARSPWSAGHYGGGTKLVSAFNSSFTYQWTPGFAGGNPGSVTTATNASTGGTIIPIVSGGSGPPTVADIIAALQGIGLTVDATHVFTPDEALKIATDYYNLTGSNAQAMATYWSGKTIPQVLSAWPQHGFDFTFGTGPALAQVGQALGFLLDAENWMLMIGLAAGVAITAWSTKHLFGAELGQAKAKVPTTITRSKTERGKVGETITVTESKAK